MCVAYFLIRRFFRSILKLVSIYLFQLNFLTVLAHWGYYSYNIIGDREKAQLLLYLVEQDDHEFIASVELLNLDRDADN